MKTKTVIAVLAVAASVIAAPGAFADRVDVTINPNASGQGSYIGTVKAKRAKCVKGRTVEVWWLDASGYNLLGTAVTDAKGRWELLDYVPQPGQQVRIDVLGRTLRKHKCPALSTIAQVPETVVIQQR
jgi:hypothetical protein